MNFINSLNILLLAPTRPTDYRRTYPENCDYNATWALIYYFQKLIKTFQVYHSSVSDVYERTKIYIGLKQFAVCFGPVN